MINLSKYVGNRIKYFREKQGLTQDRLAELLNTSRQSVSRYETGERKANQDILFELADIFNISINEFFPNINNKNSISTIYNQLEPSRQEYVYEVAEEQLEEQNRVTSLYGGVAANPAELAYGDPVYDEKITTDVPKGADGAVTIHGDSMEDFLYDGDIAFFKKQPNVENGEIAIVEIDGSGVTCKKVVKEDGKIILRSLNKKYDDRVIEKEKVRIIGKVVK